VTLPKRRKKLARITWSRSSTPGWQENVRLPYGGAWGSRFAPPQVGVRPATRQFPGLEENVEQESYEDWQPDSGWTAQREQVRDLVNSLKIGRLSIYHVSIQSAFGQQRGLGGEPVVEAEFPMTSGQGKQIHGVMTHALMDVLRQEEVSGLSFRTLATAVARRLKWLQPFMMGDNRMKRFSRRQYKSGKSMILRIHARDNNQFAWRFNF
jgi:hypothetical protein